MPWLDLLNTSVILEATVILGFAVILGCRSA